MAASKEGKQAKQGETENIQQVNSLSLCSSCNCPTIDSVISEVSGERLSLKKETWRHCLNYYSTLLFKDFLVNM